MTDTYLAAQRELGTAGYDVVLVPGASEQAIAFENDSVLGVLLSYADVDTLLARWRPDRDAVLKAMQFGLKRAASKTWNAYLILLADGPADYGQSVALEAIEEDLVGLRKIARAGTSDPSVLKLTLMPLLPLQSAPKLETVDMPAEIRMRASDVPRGAVDAFLAGTSEATLLPLLEEGP